MNQKEIEEHKIECQKKFMAAVSDSRVGLHNRSINLIDEIRKKSGVNSAKIAKKELWNFIKSDNKLIDIK